MGILPFFRKKNIRFLFAIKKKSVSLQPQKGNKVPLGYGVMVTLQILVLSFLVRIQVAQPKKMRSCQTMMSGRIFLCFLFSVGAGLAQTVVIKAASSPHFSLTRKKFFVNWEKLFS